MITKKVHTLILGAGPAGLAAGLRLAQAGVSPVLLERDLVAGGLMRSIKRGNFTLDVGRKELYSRIPEVDHLWTEVLGEEYRPYPRRLGILYAGHVLERDASSKGYRHGMPWGMLLECCIDYLGFRIKSFVSKPNNFEEYHYGKNGLRFSQIFVQGYREKFRGKKWREMPPEDELGRPGNKLIQAVTRKLTKSVGEKKAGPNWRHPALGSGQISELLEKRILEAGGNFQFGAVVTGITTSEGRINEVNVEIGDERITYQPQNVISSIPIEFLGPLLLPNSSNVQSENPNTEDDSLKKSAVLVYLFIDEPPRFSHNWLYVNSPDMKSGRITNYAAFNGDMVPPNQTCLCIEIFCRSVDPLFKLSTEELYTLALKECAQSKIVDATKCFDHLVIKLPGIDPSTTWQDWLTESRLQLMADLKPFENLFNVNRAGTDVATYAGIKASQAIVTGQRREFDQLTDPSKYPPTADW